jgi:hypothetical protein
MNIIDVRYLDLLYAAESGRGPCYQYLLTKERNRDVDTASIHQSAYASLLPEKVRLYTSLIGQYLI